MTLSPLDPPYYDLDGWGGNYTDDFGVDWVITDEDGWSSPAPARADVDDRPSGHGGIDVPTWEGPRVITLEGTAVATTRRDQNAAKDRLNRVAYDADAPFALYPLLVTEAHATRQCFVRRSGAQKITDRGSLAFDFSLTFVAPDPAKYSQDQLQVSAALAPQTGTVGRTYPRVYPLSYGGVLTGATVVDVTNDGNRSTGGQVTFHGGVYQPGVINQETGASLIFDLTLSGDDYFVLDLDRRTALLNGTASRASALLTGSAWFRLAPGDTTLRFVGTPTDPLAGPTLSVSYYSAWK